MANAKRRKVLDAWAMLAYLQGEPRGAAVRTLLEKAETGDADVLMSMVNLGEVYYVLQRQIGREAAEERILAIRQLPMTIVPADDELVLKAAEVKADHGIAYADCFAVATAVLAGASVVTGDPEFKEVEGSVLVEWL